MPSAAATAPIEPASSHLRSIAFGALIFLLALVAYWPAVHADFIWNDSDYVTAPALQSLHGLKRIWLEVGATEQYYPLLHSAFWLEHRLWGDSALGYHLVNIFLHAGAACLFTALLRRLAIRGAGLAALIFVLHPVCVESVAWISEQKNTLSLVFYLGAALAYVSAAELAPLAEAGSARENRAAPFRVATSRRRYVFASVLFLCALLSKTTTATLPAALLVVLWWKRGRLAWADARPLLPWFIIAAAMGLFSAWVEKHFIGAQGSEFALDLAQRGLLAGRITWFYLGKLIAPLNLIFIYPRWDVNAGVAWQWLFPLALLALLVAFWRARRRSRAPLAVLLLFAGSLFPVLGFFNVYAFMFSFVADHWQYLACLAVIACAAALLWRAPRFVSGAVVAAFGVLTWQQSRMYADMETFYRATIARNPACWMAHNNLGSMLRKSGRTDEAIARYTAAIKFKPDSARAHANLGSTLRDARRETEALPEFEQAVRLESENAEYQDDLAASLRMNRRTADALPHHRAAVRLDPLSTAVHNDYGVTLRDLGHGAEAIAEFEEALRLDPSSAPAHLNLSLSYAMAGREDLAKAHYLEARRLNPAIPAFDFDPPSPRP